MSLDRFPPPEMSVMPIIVIQRRAARELWMCRDSPDRTFAEHSA